MTEKARKLLRSNRPPEEIAAELEEELGLGPAGTLEAVLFLRRGWTDVTPDSELRSPEIKRASGQQIFEEKSLEEQDAMLGPAAAQAVRDGLIRVEDLAGRSPREFGPDFLTQKPLQELGIDATKLLTQEVNNVR
jgi:hypothetical protein